MELYVNGSHVGCKGTFQLSSSLMTTVSSFNRYRTAYVGFDGCIAKEANVPNLLAAAKKKTQEHRDRYSEGWNRNTPFEDAVWVYADEVRTLRFAYILDHFATEEMWTEAQFITFLRNDLVTALYALEQLLEKKETTHEHKDNVKKAANLVKLRSNSIVSTAKEGFSQNADFYRLAVSPAGVDTWPKRMGISKPNFLRRGEKL